MSQSLVPGPNLGTVTITGTVTEKQDQPAATAATWTSVTGANTAVTVTTTGYGTANVFIVVPTTVTAGVISIEVSNDGGTTYVPGGAVRADNGLQENVVALAFAPAINGSRMYAVSVDAMTHVRARLSTVITGTGNVVVTVSTVAGGIEPFTATRLRQAPTYSADYRLATVAARSNLAPALVLNTDKQIATLHHAAAATRTIRVQRVSVTVIANSTAALVTIDLRRITSAPATGNPAVTVKPHNQGNATTEAVALALPTTAGTVDNNADSYASTGMNLGVMAAITSVNADQGKLELFNVNDLGPSAQGIELRPGVLEGVAVIARAEAATTFSCYARMVWTEEPA